MTPPHGAPGRRDLLRAGGAGLAALGGLTGLAGCGSGERTATADTVTVQLWHGQNDIAKKVIEKLVADFNRTHPGIRVEAGSGGVLADGMLQKVMAGLAAGHYPDIAYIFGSNLADLARSDKVLDLTRHTAAPGYHWNDRWRPARAAATADGRVRALPALLDALCVVYNRKLFRRAGIPEPKPGWTWKEFTDTARRLTDHRRGVYGTGWPAVGDEDTAWRLWPMIWDLGGDIARHGKAAFGGRSGLRALETLAALAADHSVYLDTQPGSDQLYQVMLGGSMGMVATGPWQLPQMDEAGLDYGVVPLPSYSGRPITISGPDNWVIFDNGTRRSRAAVTFADWLGDPARDVQWDISAGSLPLRQHTAAQPAWRKQLHRTPGLQVFTEALPHARTRPALRAYPQISRALGEAVVSVLLRRATPQDALDQAVDAADSALQASA